MNHTEAAALLLAAGSPFELSVETVRGREMKVFKTRERSMREKVASAAVHGTKEFLVYDDQRVSFAEFVELTWGAAHALLDEFGLKRGDRVGILAYNRPEWLIALFGAASAGGVSVGLNGWWTTAELSYALTDSGCRYLIVDEALWMRVQPLLEQPNEVETVFYIGDHAPAGTVPIHTLLKRRSDMPSARCRPSKRSASRPGWRFPRCCSGSSSIPVWTTTI
jgi:long-chain acyl-CoA synthetase